MDWKYKHFNQTAVFKSLHQEVLDAARAELTESMGGLEDTADGFTAKGYAAFHPEIAEAHISEVSEGTAVNITLLVERLAMRSYMVVDIGGYYNFQIDKWFTGIAKRLGESGQEQALVSKTTTGVKPRRALMIGCLVYLCAGTCLALIAMPIDSTWLSKFSVNGIGPLMELGSLIGLLAGIAAFLYVMYPDAPASQSVRAWLRKPRGNDKP